MQAVAERPGVGHSQRGPCRREPIQRAVGERALTRVELHVPPDDLVGELDVPPSSRTRRLHHAPNGRADNTVRVRAKVLPERGRLEAVFGCAQRPP